MGQKKLKKESINILLKKGKKNIYLKFYNDVLFKLKKEYKINPNDAYNESIKNLLPKIKKISYKGKNILLPISKKKQINTSIKWIFSTIKPSNEIFHTMSKNSKSESLKKKIKTYEILDKLKYNL